jgi:hypothetical protein
MSIKITTQSCTEITVDTVAEAVEYLVTESLFYGDTYFVRRGDKIIDSPFYRRPESKLMSEAEFVQDFMEFIDGADDDGLPDGVTRLDLDTLAPQIIKESIKRFPTEEEYNLRYHK